MALSSIPNDGVCYFCLGEEGDDEGKPLVRDCSCRGNSGFAHLSCLTKYAEQKCRAAGDGEMATFTEPWYKCNNCKQPFQNQLAIDLASACVSFAEATYGHPDSGKWDKLKIMAALRFKINKLGDSDADRTMLINQLLDTVKQTKKDLNMIRWIHKPKGSEEYRYYRLLCVEYEAYAYAELGTLLISDTSEEGFKIAITHYKKVRAIYNLVGMKDSAQQMDTIISMQTANKQAVNNEDAPSATITNSGLEAMKKMYESNIISEGMDSVIAIQSGIMYTRALGNMGHCIEAE